MAGMADGDFTKSDLWPHMRYGLPDKVEIVAAQNEAIAAHAVKESGKRDEEYKHTVESFGQMYKMMAAIAAKLNVDDDEIQGAKPASKAVYATKERAADKKVIAQLDATFVSHLLEISADYAGKDFRLKMLQLDSPRVASDQLVEKWAKVVPPKLYETELMVWEGLTEAQKILLYYSMSKKLASAAKQLMAGTAAVGEGEGETESDSITAKKVKKASAAVSPQETTSTSTGRKRTRTTRASQLQTPGSDYLPPLQDSPMSEIHGGHISQLDGAYEVEPTTTMSSPRASFELANRSARQHQHRQSYDTAIPESRSHFTSPRPMSAQVPGRTGGVRFDRPTSTSPAFGLDTVKVLPTKATSRLDVLRDHEYLDPSTPFSQHTMRTISASLQIKPAAAAVSTRVAAEPQLWRQRRTSNLDEGDDEDGSESDHASAGSGKSTKTTIRRYPAIEVEEAEEEL
ncbi:hypothetical protein LTR10_011033 [Elasticomyces elasticus]|nr:hypothetical protein LTR10_011033 [Elasticomyces elasticus]KAK4968636.1 hypothetical protein LTR42_009919 [Elasticomyces elasticus]